MTTTATKPHISLTDYRTFLKTLPEDVQHETYRFLNARFSIPHALFVIQQFQLLPEQVDRADIEKLANCFGVAYDSPAPGAIKVSLLDRALHDGWIAQLLETPQDAPYPLKSKPIIALETTFGKGKNKQTSWFLIDGGHRLRYHFLKESEALEIVMIPKIYAHLIQVR